MNKTDELILGEESSPNVQEEVALFNRYFKSVYFLNSPAKSKVLNPKHEDEPTLTKIFISKKSVSMILQNAATTKARETEGIPHVFFRKLAKPSSHALHLNSKAIKRTTTIPDVWNSISVLHIRKKEENHFVGKLQTSYTSVFFEQST